MMSDTDKIALIGRIDQALEDVRPHLAVDGGNVEVVDLTEDNIVKIKWLGTCEGCSMSMIRACLELAPADNQHIRNLASHLKSHLSR
jgi:Fe-S cluster biogenesis protein NfuA